MLNLGNNGGYFAWKPLKIKIFILFYWVC